MKLLVLLPRFPYPLDKGDKLRAFHQLRYLAKHHEICLFALSDVEVTPQDYAQVAPLCVGGVHVYRLRRPGIALNMARALAIGLPFQAGYFYDSGAQKVLDGVLQAFQPDHVYCQLVRMTEYLRRQHRHWPCTLDYMDVFSAGMTRRAGRAPAWQRPVIKMEAARLRRYEAQVFDWFRHHTIISDQDRQLIDHPQRQEIRVVLNGIDTQFFHPMHTSKEYAMVFCGGMSYYPNVDAAAFLAEEILPLVREKHPHARLLIAGTSPTARVQALASEAVTVSGWLEDIRTAYAGAQVFVAPMRTGTGLQNKLLEAMAMSLPCVTTPLANAPLRGVPGEHVLVGETAAELAAHINELLDKPAHADALARRGMGFVEETYNWEAATGRLNALLEQ